MDKQLLQLYVAYHKEMLIAFGKHFRRVWIEQKAFDQLIEITELASF